MTTLGLNSNDNICCDLTKSTPNFSQCFDIVIHAAGDITPQQADAVNFDGTRRLCQALEANPPQALVYISSLSVYGLTEGVDIDETAPLAPVTVYGKSKLKAEQFLTQWCADHDVTLSILRPAMIVGTGMKGTLGAMVKGIASGYYFHIKDNEARRSVIHASDVALAARLIAPVGGVYNLTDRIHPTIHDLAEAIAHRLGDRRIYSLPLRCFEFAARIGNHLSFIPFSSSKLAQLTNSLTFSSDAISKAIDWQPRDVVNFLLTHKYDENDL